MTRPLITYDCFDTVITRATGEARSVGYVVAARARAAGLLDVDPEVFVRARLRAEHLVFVRLGERRTLTDICGQLAELLGLPPSAAPELEHLEVDVELDLCRSVPARVAQVRADRATGAQIGFLSDTALSSTVLGRMLRAAGVIEDGDLLWVSNELGASKSEGLAYAEVARGLPQPPPRWHHTGDNERADVLMARIAGISTTVAPQARLTRYERVLDDTSKDSGGLSSLFAGASRRARLVLAAQPAGGADDRLDALTGVLAPLLAGYSLWALARAREVACTQLQLVGPGAPALAQVLVPIAAAVAPEVVVQVRGMGAADATGLGRRVEVSTQVSTRVLDRASAAGAELSLHLGVSATGAEESGLVRGYLFDEPAGLGLCGDDQRAVTLLASLCHETHPVVEAFGEELVGVLARLDHAADVRSSLWAAAALFWGSPSVAEVSAWSAARPGLLPQWPAGRRALAAPATRLLARAGAVGGAVWHKGVRAGTLARARVGRRSR